MKNVIFTKNAPVVVGPYSQGLLVGDLLFCAGQIGVNPETNELPEGVVEQAKQVMENLKAVLEEAKLSMDNVVRAEIFLTNINDYKAVNEVYAAYFSKHFPTRQAVAVAALPRDAKVEISLIAAKED